MRRKCLTADSALSVFAYVVKLFKIIIVDAGVCLRRV